MLVLQLPVPSSQAVEQRNQSEFDRDRPVYPRYFSTALTEVSTVTRCSPVVSEVMRVCHVTTVHHWDDGRIFDRQARALVDAGHEVAIIAPSADVLRSHGVAVVAVGGAHNRYLRALVAPWRAFRCIRRLRPDVVVLHDPELLVPALLTSQRRSRPVLVYDAHEDYRIDILGKEWLPKPLRSLVATVFGLIEDLTARRVDAVIVATPSIQERFGPQRAEIVLNRPRTEGLPLLPTSSSKSHQGIDGSPSPLTSPFQLVYAGDIREVRGIRTVLEASAHLGAIDHRVVLFGRITPPSLEEDLRRQDSWSRVDFRGWRPQTEVFETLSVSDVGLLPLLPVGSYSTSHPNKLFEYLCTGIPVVMSDFLVWKELAEEVGARYEVFEPGDPQSLANALLRVYEQPDADRRHERARRARECFEWESLQAAYVDLIEASFSAHK